MTLAIRKMLLKSIRLRKRCRRLKKLYRRMLLAKKTPLRIGLPSVKKGSLKKSTKIEASIMIFSKATSPPKKAPVLLFKTVGLVLDKNLLIAQKGRRKILVKLACT